MKWKICFALIVIVFTKNCGANENIVYALRCLVLTETGQRRRVWDELPQILRFGHHLCCHCWLLLNVSEVDG